MKIPECDRCLLYSHDPHRICEVHPEGVESDRCIDFRLDPNFKEEEQWSFKGYSWYGDNLISNKPSKYTPEQQLDILDNHPFFTGVCPICKYKFDRDNPPIHYDCHECGFIDDSV